MDDFVQVVILRNRIFDAFLSQTSSTCIISYLSIFSLNFHRMIILMSL